MTEVAKWQSAVCLAVLILEARRRCECYLNMAAEYDEGRRAQDAASQSIAEVLSSKAEHL